MATFDEIRRKMTRKYGSEADREEMEKKSSPSYSEPAPVLRREIRRTYSENP